MVALPFGTPLHHPHGSPEPEGAHDPGHSDLGTTTILSKAIGL